MKKLAIIFAVLLTAGCSQEQSLRDREPLPLLRQQAWKNENPTCSVKGNSANWQAAYCMWMSRTNDYESDAVQECYKSMTERTGIPKAFCERNEFFKKEICKTLVVDKTFEGTVTDCLKSDSSVPRVVREGLDPVS